MHGCAIHYIMPKQAIGTVYTITRNIKWEGVIPKGNLNNGILLFLCIYLYIYIYINKCSEQTQISFSALP